MHRLAVFLMICLLAACSGTPPRPAGVSGDYRPINPPQASRPAQAIPQVFDFFYEGDIQGALEALSTIQPQVTVTPAIGRPVPVKVRINLRETNLETALRAIGDQGGRIADVVWYSPTEQIEHRVFIRYRGPEPKPTSNPVTR
ncbi:MAG: hypothetical protein RIR70_592 [Pseudomonadota bacterium]|jgi:hypothetical protein